MIYSSFVVSIGLDIFSIL